MLVLAHEWGHHLQYLDGKFDNRSLRIELGADCYAGIFASYVDDRGLFGQELGDVKGTIKSAAASIFLKGHTFQNWFDPGVHGTPRQRKVAFSAGLLTEDPTYCRAYETFEPSEPIEIAGYRADPLPGATVASHERKVLELTFRDVEATVVGLFDLSEEKAKDQIGTVLASWFRDRRWNPHGPVQDTEATAVFGGSMAIQPFSLDVGSSTSYGAVLLHVSGTGRGLLIEVTVGGDIATAGPDPFQRVGDFLYTILEHTCPPITREVSCLHPLG